MVSFCRDFRGLIVTITESLLKRLTASDECILLERVFMVVSSVAGKQFRMRLDFLRQKTVLVSD